MSASTDRPQIRRLQRLAEAIGKQRHIVAARDGVVGALPLILVGSLFLLIAQFPVEAVRERLGPHVPLLLVPYRVLGGLIAVYVTFAAAYSLARSYQLDPMANGLVAMACYLLAAYPTPVPPAIGAVVLPHHLPVARLGAGGIFAGLLIAMVAVELTRLLVRRNWTIRMPSTAPEIIVRSFLALIPALLLVTLTWLVVHVVGVDLVVLLERAAAPLLIVTGSLPAALMVVAIDSGLWIVGVHASAALTGPLKPLWEAMLVQNMEAAAAGHSPLPHIATQHFYLWFVWQGGSGGTLALALLLWRARSAQLRGVAKVGAVPALFNINEPILFGAPVVLNPRLAIPFFVAPLVCTVTAYAAMALHLVRPPFLELPWTLPAPVGAFLSTGGDVRALALQLFNLALSMLIYWPFLRRYDSALLAQEASRQAPTASASG